MAQDALTTDPNAWIVTLKGNANVGPAYPGAKSFSFFGYPSLSLRRASTPATFSAPDDNFSLALYDLGWLKVGPSGKIIGERRAGDHRELTGIHDVDWAVEGGAFVEFWPMQQIRGRIDIRHGLHGHYGWVGDIGLDYVQTAGAWTFSVGPRAAFGDSSYTNRYFGVTLGEAIANTRVAPYTPTGGFTSVGATASATYAFSPQWAATGYVRYDQLVGSASRSPIVRTLGTDQQFTFGVKLAYSFATTGF